jgi:hypothetical protein
LLLMLERLKNISKVILKMLNYCHISTNFIRSFITV